MSADDAAFSSIKRDGQLQNLPSGHQVTEVDTGRAKKLPVNNVVMNGPSSSKQKIEKRKENRSVQAAENISDFPQSTELANKDMLVRAVAVNSKKLNLHQQALILMQQKLDEDEEKLKTQEEIDALLLFASESKRNISKLQEKVSMQEAEIAKLNQRIMDIESGCQNGILVWEIKRYKNQKSDAIAGNPKSLYSRTFVSSRFGYHMCARLYLNGDGVGKGTHLSVFFAVKNGPYDNILPWPFRPKVTFRLLNQAGKPPIEDAFFPDPESVSFQKPTKDINIAAGCPKFALQHHLENPHSGFLMNDTIFLLVKIDTSSLEF